MRAPSLPTTGVGRPGLSWIAALSIAVLGCSPTPAAPPELDAGALDAGEDAGGDVDAPEVDAPLPIRDPDRDPYWNPAPSTGSSTSGTVPAIPPRSGLGVDTRSAVRTLVLYDVGGTFGAVGEGYAIGTANLASHFGGWTAVPAVRYECGSIERYDATIYLGSSYDEPLPTCLLDDVLGASRPVMWVYFNVWQLVARAGGIAAFQARYGMAATTLDMARYSAVRYDGRTLPRAPENPGLLSIRIDGHRAITLATALREDGSGHTPWAVRSGRLWLVAEIPFAYSAEEDRILAFEDLLFDLYDVEAPERHRAVLRLEDLNPLSDPRDLRHIADYLGAVGVPFGFGLVPEYRDPDGVGTGGIPTTLTLTDTPALVDAIRYLIDRGGVPVMHGRSHQWDGGPNPLNRHTGDDSEFIRVEERPDHTLTLVGPLPEDSFAWAYDRIESGAELYRAAGLPVPEIFEFPHYMASADSYAAASTLFETRWERALYFGGALGTGRIDHSRWLGQAFPYVVRDVYGARVLPENLGNVERTPVFAGRPRLPADIVRTADAALVVRDNVAGFFFHPFLPLGDLIETVSGIRALGYEFVDPRTL